MYFNVYFFLENAMDNDYARLSYHCFRETQFNIYYSKSMLTTITMQGLAPTAAEKHTLM